MGLYYLIFFLMLPGYCYAAGDFEVTLNTSRTQGVAPLSVFFDGTRTPDLAGGSYVDATFAWDFDADNADPDANHRRSGGFVAAHVFEKPGVYRVRVDLSDQAPVIYNTAVDSDWGTLDIGNDWRIMDLRVRSGGSSAGEEGSRYSGGVGFGSSTNGLIYRLEQDHLASGWMAPYGQYNTVAECNIHDVSGTGYCSNGDGGAIIGNWGHDKGPEDPEHIFRLQGGTRYFIAFNNFEANVVNYDSLTIRGNTSKVVIYKNYEMGINIGDDTVVGPSQRIKIYNNTFINMTAGSPLIDKGRFTGVVYDYYGNKRDLATDIGAVDTQSPSVPQGVTALSASSSRIDLSWDAATDNIAVAGYRIYCGGGQIGATTGTAFSHTNCAAATRYTYTIRAYDAAGNTSDPSDEVSATTQAAPDTGGGSGGGGGGGCFIRLLK